MDRAVPHYVIHLAECSELGGGYYYEPQFAAEEIGSERLGMITESPWWSQDSGLSPPASLHGTAVSRWGGTTESQTVGGGLPSRQLAPMNGCSYHYS